MFQHKIINISLFVIVLLSPAFAANGNHTKSDIPCEFDSDCSVQNIRSSQKDVKSTCVENFCMFSVSAPETLKVVTTLGARCRFNEECNIAQAICENTVCTCTNETTASFSRRKCIPEAKKIGDDCEEDSQCNFPQTTCRAGKCQCEPGFGVDQTKNGTECKTLNGIGTTCKLNEDCEVDHTECTNNTTCNCIQGYSAYKKECYVISTGFLGTCDIDYQCQKVLGPDSICIKNRCHCEAKHLYNVLQSRCVRPSENLSNQGSRMLNQDFYLYIFGAIFFYLRM